MKYITFVFFSLIVLALPFKTFASEHLYFSEFEQLEKRFTDRDNLRNDSNTIAKLSEIDNDKPLEFSLPKHLQSINLIKNNIIVLSEFGNIIDFSFVRNQNKIKITPSSELISDTRYIMIISKKGYRKEKIDFKYDYMLVFDTNPNIEKLYPVDVYYEHSPVPNIKIDKYQTTYEQNGTVQYSTNTENVHRSLNKLFQYLESEQIDVTKTLIEYPLEVEIVFRNEPNTTAHFQKKDVLYFANGRYYQSNKNKIVFFLSPSEKSHLSFRETTIHELGHYIHLNFFENTDRENTYMNLRGIKLHNQETDDSKLFWSERITEMFSEDLKTIFYKHSSNGTILGSIRDNNKNSYLSLIKEALRTTDSESKE